MYIYTVYSSIKIIIFKETKKISRKQKIYYFYPKLQKDDAQIREAFQIVWGAQMN